jgi:glycerophosphoryl diester phosphodiesterase
VNENLPFVVIGHRGCAGVEPENTLRGIRRAIDLGCEMVEVDVRKVDGELVLIHDDSVDRTSSSKGRIEDFSLTELRDLDFGKGEVIPLLVEVLNLCEGKVKLNIELKGKGVAVLVVSLLKQREGRDDVVISSFDWSQLTQVSSQSDLPIAVLVLNKSEELAAFDLARELSAESINPSLEMIDRSFVELAHRMGLSVACYTVISVADAKKVIKLGADACFADDPQMVMNLL